MDINKDKEGRRRTLMNDRNPKCRSMVRERGDLRRLLSSGGTRRNSGTFRSMQRPRLVQQLKVDGGGRGRRVERHEDDDEVKRHEGENGKTPGPIYKGDKRQTRKSRSRIFGYEAMLSPRLSEAR